MFVAIPFQGIQRLDPSLSFICQDGIRGVANGSTVDLDVLGSGLSVSPKLQRADPHLPMFAQFGFSEHGWCACSRGVRFALRMFVPRLT